MDGSTGEITAAQFEETTSIYHNRVKANFTLKQVKHIMILVFQMANVN